MFTNGLVFQKTGETCDLSQGCWGGTESNVITIYLDAEGALESNPLRYNNFLVHEMGHVYDNTLGGALTQNFEIRSNPSQWYSGWPEMPTGDDGFADDHFSKDSLWILGHHEDGTYEETADMFLGWVYGEWEPGNDLRGRWMEHMMSHYFLKGVTDIDYNGMDSAERCAIP